MPRAERLLHILLTLQSTEPYDVDKLAKECGVSGRGILRDIRSLRARGFSITFDRKSRRYFLTDASLPVAKDLEFEEAAAIAVLCREIGRRCQLPFYEMAYRGAEKIVASLDPESRRRLQEIASIVRIDLEAVNPLAHRKAIYDRLMQAILDRKQVRLHYQSFTEERAIDTRLSPYRLLFQRRSWYVVGKSSLHREVRTFNVGRILKLRELDRPAKIPKSFRLSEYLRNAWRILPEQGDDSTVVLKFRKMVAGNVEEVRWHPTQKVRRLVDGGALFTARVSGLEEISWWILGYGPEVEAIEPPELRQRIADRIEAMRAIYAKKPAAGELIEDPTVTSAEPSAAESGENRAT
ncbi:MAG TPA: WYL domain-containing protein [Pirellulaceae bacterium]|nr:WYL domain-containing protein [Pirellulaceae bacterium]